MEETIDSTMQACYILLACDGLWDVMSSKDAGELLVQFTREKLEAQEMDCGRGVALAGACQDLVKEALKRYMHMHMCCCLKLIVILLIARIDGITLWLLSLTDYDDLRGSKDNITVLAISVGEEGKESGSNTINRFDMTPPPVCHSKSLSLSCCSAYVLTPTTTTFFTISVTVALWTKFLVQ